MTDPATPAGFGACPVGLALELMSKAKPQAWAVRLLPPRDRPRDIAAVPGQHAIEQSLLLDLSPCILQRIGGANIETHLAISRTVLQSSELRHDNFF